MALLEGHPSAVAWIDRRHALVATTTPTGKIALRETRRQARMERDDDLTDNRSRGVSDEETTFLQRVAAEIGDRERVVILGPGRSRLTLEREYVSIYHRPDQLVDVEPSGPLARAEIVDRLRTLTV